MLVPDVELEPKLAEHRDDFAREAIRAITFLPLSLDAGVFGTVALYYAEPHAGGEHEVEIAQAIAGQAALATQNKRAELARIRSEHWLQAILNNSESVIFFKDLNGNYLPINRRFEELFHVSRASVLGHTDYDFFPAATADIFRANDLAVLQAGKPLAIEEYAPQDDGTHTYISMKFPFQGRWTAVWPESAALLPISPT